MEAVDPIVDHQEFHLKLTPTAGSNEVTIYLAANNAGDGTKGDFVLWREPRLVIPGRPPVLLRDAPALIDSLTSRRQTNLRIDCKSADGCGRWLVNCETRLASPTSIGIDPEDR